MSPPDLAIEADPAAVERILTTLMRNAVKFAPEGGAVEVGAEAIADRIYFYVEDNGPGIAAEDIARLGRPFEQGDVVMANGMKGSGLGLAIANSLVELAWRHAPARLAGRRGRGGGGRAAEGAARTEGDRARKGGVIAGRDPVCVMRSG